jgi:hypothetical protein
MQHDGDHAKCVLDYMMYVNLINCWRYEHKIRMSTEHSTYRFWLEYIYMFCPYMWRNAEVIINHFNVDYI